ncbi:ThuA domain-containing protein [Labilibaculum sp.]|uniref:ThuA domain-containing protein n=1 Tax=Labilibaculum sp. TaxID=2060723 RepID=UPI003566D257
MKIEFTILILSVFMFGLQANATKVLLLTGQTDPYHNWEVTSSYLKATLDHQAIFETDVLLIPSEEEMDTFSLDFSKYQVVVLDQNGPDWPDKVQKNFADYVYNGGGVVIVHEANNAFPDWKEYNQICGLGGWKGRNEKSGPYLYWKEGKAVKDYSPGKGGSHGKRVLYVVNIRDSEHPITKGLPMKWLHQNDELYGNLRGPAENIHVLATAYSDSASNGTGKEELVLFTVTYGKGRVFHTVMGHTHADFCDSVQDVGFQVTFSRGTEWAATGKVKQELPAEFPTETQVLLRELSQLK